MEMKMRNYMEVCVENALDGILDKYNICKCERCRADIMAIALNHLKPKYVVTPSGERFAKLNVLEQQFDIDVTTEIIKAIEIVRNNVRHDL